MEKLVHIAKWVLICLATFFSPIGILLVLTKGLGLDLEVAMIISLVVLLAVSLTGSTLLAISFKRRK